jgi:ankyrin repeat protein
VLTFPPMALQGSGVEAVNVMDYPPLYWAAHQGHAPLVDLLLQRGADPSRAVCGGMGSFALLAAVANNHTAAAAALLRHPRGRATANDQEVFSGRTPLWMACFNDNADMVRLGAVTVPAREKTWATGGMPNVPKRGNWLIQ